MDVKTKWQSLQVKINEAALKSNRNPDHIQVIAVTKYVDVPRIEEAHHAGLSHIAESKVQDALKKWDTMDKQIREKQTWHFIGHLQTNKVKDMIGKFSYIHSLDRLSLAKEINKRKQNKEGRSEEFMPDGYFSLENDSTSYEGKVSCFVQVNVAEESTKHGLKVSDTERFILELQKYPHIHVVGLMTMAPFEDNPERTRPIFRELKELQLRLQQKKWLHAPLPFLSMGMSNDFHIAIEEGATHVRIGTSLVGD